MYVELSLGRLRRELDLIRGFFPRGAVCERFIHLHADAGKLTLGVWDQTCLLECELQADVKQSGAVYLKGSVLTDLVERSSGQGSLEIVPNGMLLTDGAFTAILPLTYTRPQLPKLTPLWSQLTTFPAAELAKMIGTVAHAIPDRVAMIPVGALLSLSSSDVHMTATDGVRLARARAGNYESQDVLTALGGADQRLEFIVPRATLLMLASLLKDEKGDVTVQHGANKSLRFITAGRRLATLSAQGAFPACDRLFQSDTPIATIEVGRDDLLAAIRRVATVAELQNAETILEWPGQDLVLSTPENPDRAARDTVAATITAHGSEKIKLNGKFLSELAGALSTDTVRLQVFSGSKPVRLQDPDGAAVGLLMPMRL